MRQMHEIWWKQLGSSLRLFQDVLDVVQQERSMLLRIPENIPWKAEFHAQMEQELRSLNPSLYLLDAQQVQAEDLDEYLLERFCSTEMQLAYWPFIPLPEYLAGAPELPMHQSIVWVREIPNAAALQKWKMFVRQYDKAVKDSADKAAKNKGMKALPHKAVFLLEAAGAVQDSDFPTLLYQVRKYDCHIFCMEVAASNAQPEYLTELAVRIGGHDPEACAMLLAEPDALLADPVEASKRILVGRHYSDGRLVSPPQEEALHSAVLLAQIAQAFPRMEQFRLHYVQENAEELRKYLPMTDRDGRHQVDDPLDLELGHLNWLCDKENTNISEADCQKIRTFRGLRNKLAHNDLLTFAEMEKLCAL